MEAKIKKIISNSSSGDGNGSGYGNGNSYGSGSGYGSGNGYGSISDPDSGYGDGYSSGDGNGFGYGFGNGNGFKIKMYKGNLVYYIDNIPCTFNSVHDNWACVNVINDSDFTSKKAFIAKESGFYAHGETIKEAFKAVKTKIFCSMSFEEKKVELLKEFEVKGKLSVAELFTWHGILTGSCEFGRKEFMNSHELKEDDYLTLKEFVDLTKNSFGGDKIRMLI